MPARSGVQPALDVGSRHHRPLRRLDGDLWRESRLQPGADAAADLPGAARRARPRTRPSWPSSTESASSSGPTCASRMVPAPVTRTRRDLSVAYFCMEFGLDECLPIYSGGLGVLAGDHLKAASGLGLPLVGVGLLYQKGYFTQYLSSDGWQLERYPVNDFSTLPVQPARPGRRLRRSWCTVDLAGSLGGRAGVAWRRWAHPSLPARHQPAGERSRRPGRHRRTLRRRSGGAHPPGDRPGHRRHAGPGGPGHRAVRVPHERGALGLPLAGADPHAHGSGGPRLSHGAPGLPAQAPCSPPTRRSPRASTCSRARSWRATSATTSRNWGSHLDELLQKGACIRKTQHEDFNVAALAVRHSPRRNAVSRLHRRVTARMMQRSVARVPPRRHPGGVGHQRRARCGGGCPARWRACSTATWALAGRRIRPILRCGTGSRSIPDEELWRTHVRQRERLVSVRARSARRSGGAAPCLAAGDRCRQGGAHVRRAHHRLRPPFRHLQAGHAAASRGRPTEGHPPERARPVQLIFAGKAHPRDDAGKELIRQIVHFAAQEGLQHRIVFLEDYDLGKARELVRGVDVWLNTPRRPMEASGTSGMKVVPNGGLNLSVLDGWWVEGYRPEAGWAIGSGEEYADLDYQDRVESQALYSLLEQEVIPLFYERSADGLPRGWIHMMKSSMRHLGPAFSAARMVGEYAERFYLPAADHHRAMVADGYAKARSLAAWKTRVRDAWSEVSVVSVENGGAGEVAVGSLLSGRGAGASRLAWAGRRRGRGVQRRADARGAVGQRAGDASRLGRTGRRRARISRSRRLRHLGRTRATRSGCCPRRRGSSSPTSWPW